MDKNVVKITNFLQIILFAVIRVFPAGKKIPLSAVADVLCG